MNTNFDRYKDEDFGGKRIKRVGSNKEDKYRKNHRDYADVYTDDEDDDEDLYPRS